MGRKPIGKRAMTATQRQRRHRQRLRRDMFRFGPKALRRAAREHDLAAQTAAAAAELKGLRKVNVILIDPPLRFKVYSSETGMDRAAENHYHTMVDDAIEKLELPADKDCVIFLWATVPKAAFCIDLLRKWGFTYKSMFVWVKPKVGTGYWNRNQHELLLLGTKGNIPAPSPGTQFPSVICAPRCRHSEKPEIVYEMIERMFPNLPKIEMFARKTRPGWDSWGNEVPMGGNQHHRPRRTGE
jgi:N6-adenosine-specific RNA methylase IME4